MRKEYSIWIVSIVSLLLSVIAVCVAVWRSPDLDLDCFKLSFCLMGMNSADLYNATDYDGEYITYCRTKTKGCRNDHAKMVVRVHPMIKDLIEKYRGEERVFNFHERFSSMADLNR